MREKNENDHKRKVLRALFEVIDTGTCSNTANESRNIASQAKTTEQINWEKYHPLVRC